MLHNVWPIHLVVEAVNVYSIAMNTYRPIETACGHWVVGWWIDGIWVAPVWGNFDTEAEAAFYAYNLALAEYQGTTNVNDNG